MKKLHKNCFSDSDKLFDNEIKSNIPLNIDHTSIINKFKKAISENNCSSLEEILLDIENYDIQNQKNETISVGKNEFLNWFVPILNSTIIEDIQLDHCLFCKIGNPVLIINKGTFPRKLKNHSEFEKTGLMLEFANDKISGITFCYTFLKNENQSMFQSNLKKIQELEQQGISKEVAFKTILGFDMDNVDF